MQPGSRLETSVVTPVDCGLWTFPLGERGLFPVQNQTVFNPKHDFCLFSVTNIPHLQEERLSPCL